MYQVKITLPITDEARRISAIANGIPSPIEQLPWDSAPTTSVSEPAMTMDDTISSVCVCVHACVGVCL